MEKNTVPFFGSSVPAPKLGLGKGHGIGRIKAHDFAGRAHFRAEQGVNTREPGKREDRFLDGDMLEVPGIGLAAVIGEGFVNGLASHDAGCDLCNRAAKGLGNKRHGARSARIDLDDVNIAFHDGVLHVHQAADIECLCEQFRLALEFVERLHGQGVNRQGTGAVAGVNAGFLDMFHDAGHKGVFAVGEAINVEFDGIGQIAVKQQRVLAEQGVDLAGLVVGITGLDFFRHETGNRIQQIGWQGRFIMNDLHRPATQHIGWAHHQREAEFPGNEARLLDGIGDAVSRLAQIQLVQEFLETVAILGKVDRIGRGAKNRNARILQGIGKFQRCLAAELDDDAVKGAL